MGRADERFKAEQPCAMDQARELHRPTNRAPRVEQPNKNRRPTDTGPPPTSSLSHEAASYHAQSSTPAALSLNARCPCLLPSLIPVEPPCSVLCHRWRCSPAHTIQRRAPIPDRRRLPLSITSVQAAAASLLLCHRCRRWGKGSGASVFGGGGRAPRICG